MPYGNANTTWPYAFSPAFYSQKQEVIKVHGEEGAKAYSLPPNSSVLLLDETAPIVWLKTTDGASYPTVTGYNITPIATVQQEQRATIDSLEDRISKLERIMNGKSNSQSAKRQQNGTAENG